MLVSVFAWSAGTRQLLRNEIAAAGTGKGAETSGAGQFKSVPA